MLTNAMRSELTAISGLSVLTEPDDLERYSRDAYDYSPVLRERLADCRADVVVRPDSVDAVVQVAGLCRRHGVPLTLRGSGTGNYGQCVPLEAGVVMLMSHLRSVRAIDHVTGDVTVECGCLLKDLNRELVAQGRQLRLMPSTWRSATIGGFIAGGSGGIGSVRWGFLRDPGHLLGLEVVTLEREPRVLQLEASEAEALNHAYGTNGILTALTLATAPSIAWQELVVDSPDWSTAVELARRCCAAAIDLHLCTVLEAAVVEQLPQWDLPVSAKDRLLLLVAPDAVSTVHRLATAAGAVVTHLGSEADRHGNGLKELTWNHTTLHLRQRDSAWTYLQMLLPQPELAFLDSLKQSWGDDLLWHLEGVRQQGAQRLAALPLVRWRGAEALERLIQQCRDQGALIFNPHELTVEGGGLGVIDGDQVATKHRFDPAGLLNPGKLGGFSS